MCCLRNIAIRDYQQSVTDGQTDAQTDDGQSDWYVPLCFAGDTKTCANIPNLSVIILIPLYAIKHVICAKIIQIHGSANDLICICLDFYLNKIELN